LDTALGLGIAFSLWWIYFDSVDGSEARAFYNQRKVGVYICWLYIQFDSDDNNTEIASLMQTI
jgi:hypothetical protein